MSMTNLNALTAETSIYNYSPDVSVSATYRARVNGHQVLVYHTAVADFLAVTCAGCCEVEIELNAPARTARVRPAHRSMAAKVDDRCISFTVPSPQNLCLEVDDLLPLFVFINPPEQDVPDPEDPTVHYFHAGKVYDAGEITLRDNETLYIEGGAVVRGAVYACGAKNIRIRGRGILDGGAYPRHARKHVVLEGCAGILVEDLIIIRLPCWTLVLGASRDIIVRNLKAIGEVISSDGIDIVGSRDVLIEGCFLRNNDDCVVVKACDQTGQGASMSWRHDVSNVLVRDCVLLNAECGNAMEIGYELRTAEVRDITFRNCDVLSVHGLGAVFSIHNGDYAVVQDILFEDIRVEHCYEKFLDFRVFDSCYSHEPGQGTIRRVTLRDIHWQRGRVSFGYTVSIIGGYDAAHPIAHITFENLFVNGQRVTTLDAIELHTRHTTGIQLLDKGK